MLNFKIVLNLKFVRGNKLVAIILLFFPSELYVVQICSRCCHDNDVLALTHAQSCRRKQLKQLLPAKLTAVCSLEMQIAG
jgi:hypothetical protein